MLNMIKITETKIQAIIVSAMNEGLAMFKKRVFLEGKDASGQNIGKYNTAPIYVPLKPQGKGYAGPAGSQVTNKGMKPRGKKPGGSGTGYVYGPHKNGKPRESMYFEDGYKEYRETVKRKTDKVNLELTGDLNFNCRIGLRSGKGVVAEIVGELPNIKAAGNEKRFGKTIFVFSAVEAATVGKEIERRLDRLFLGK